VDGRPGFIWRRHAIENYLLEPRVIAEAFNRLRASLEGAPRGAPAWAGALPGDPDTVAAALRECAAARAPQEAGRIAVHRLWEDLSATAGRIQRRVPDLLGARTHPDAPSCRLALVDEAQRLMTAAGEAAMSPLFAPTSIEARYDAALSEIREPEYLRKMQFLEDFNGKDLLWELCEWLRRHGQVRMKEARLTEELSNALPDVYRGNPSLHGADDFRDLANGVRALAGLPKLA
jgi:hypothetical protein